MPEALVSLSLLFLLSAGGTAPPPAANALPGDKLSEPSRRAIGQRMRHHAEDLTDLLKAVLLLDHDGVEERARALAEAPKLSQPAPGEIDTLNASIPKRFFELQNDFVKKAKALGQTAKQHDDVKMGKAFGQLTEACVACHSVYLWQSSGETH
jgi:cytochrome c556